MKIGEHPTRSVGCRHELCDHPALSVREVATLSFQPAADPRSRPRFMMEGALLAPLPVNARWANLQVCSATLVMVQSTRFGLEEVSHKPLCGSCKGPTLNCRPHGLPKSWRKNQPLVFSLNNENQFCLLSKDVPLNQPSFPGLARCGLDLVRRSRCTLWTIPSANSCSTKPVAAAKFLS